MTLTKPVYFLLVDDLPENLLSLEALLRREGLILLKANSGIEALELLLKHEVALALLDVQMPSMDGFELAELMRTTERTRRIPIIFLTAGSADRQRRFRGYEAGAVDFLQKPIEPDILRSKADVFFELYRQQQLLEYQRDELKISADENARLLKETIQYARALEEADRRKDDFIANMSHEIRTPMNVVLGLAGILERSSPLTSQQEEYIKTLRLSAECLLAFINDVLDFSKIEKQAFALENIAFDLSKIINEVAAQMSVSADEKDLALSFDTASIDGKCFMGDPTRIKQVLMNLCSNAIKFTNAGSVSIAVRYSAQETSDDCDLVISVTDTGIGVPEDKLDIIFDKFTQADSSITRKFGGTGLGLAISKAFVEMMKGKIDVVSKFGNGSTFNVYLRLSECEKTKSISVKTDEKSKTETKKSERLKVLVVEDYQPNAMIAEIYLKELDFYSRAVENGFLALDILKNEPFDIVLMDIQMPEINGYETTAMIRNYENIKNKKPIKIIGVTAYALQGDRQRCIDAGMDDYIAKPFDAEKLQNAISSLISN